jgi:hypothetical protein
VEAASTGPFFHNNAVRTIEAAVAFYDGDAFNQSPAGQRLKSLDPEGKAIELDATQVDAIAGFLRVINALEAIRQASELLKTSEVMRSARRDDPKPNLELALGQLDTGITVLSQGGLHPAAVAHLKKARQAALQAMRGEGLDDAIQEAIRQSDQARSELVE